MGTIGIRHATILKKEEPSLLGNVNDIVREMQSQGCISDCNVDIISFIEKRDDINIYVDNNLMSSQSGYLRRDKNDKIWTIGVNAKHSKKRQKFTIAHEFAHFILHSNKNQNENDLFEDEIFFRDDNLTSIEYAANRFAAELIMPEDLVRQEIKVGKTSLEDLSEKFGVSVLALKYRVVSLGYKLTNE